MADEMIPNRRIQFEVSDANPERIDWQMRGTWNVQQLERCVAILQDEITVAPAESAYERARRNIPRPFGLTDMGPRE